LSPRQTRASIHAKTAMLDESIHQTLVLSLPPPCRCYCWCQRRSQCTADSYE